MAIFGQIPKSELGTTFTHYGWFGMCPVYLAHLNGPCPTIAERNWVPEWWLSLNHHLVGTYIMLRSLMDEDYEPMFGFVISGEF